MLKFKEVLEITSLKGNFKNKTFVLLKTVITTTATQQQTRMEHIFTQFFGRKKTRHFCQYYEQCLISGFEVKLETPSLSFFCLGIDSMDRWLQTALESLGKLNLTCNWSFCRPGISFLYFFPTISALFWHTSEWEIVMNQFWHSSKMSMNQSIFVVCFER